MAPMALPAAIQHPVFGTLRLEEEDGGSATFRGEAWLTSKHRIVIQLELETEEESLKEALAAAQAAYNRFRRQEAAHRLRAAELLLPEIHHFFSPDYTPEQVAEHLSAVQLDLGPDGLATVHYGSGRKFKAEPIAAEFGDDGTIETVDDLN
jgi:hypothetical protein